jgi:hypothetical protein
MDVNSEDFRRYYDSLSDEALLEVDKEELVDVALSCYNEELRRRRLVRENEQEELAKPDTERAGEMEDAVLAAAFSSMEEASLARTLLQGAAIPCSLENEYSHAFVGSGGLRLMVPAAFLEEALEILDAEISEEDLIAEAEAAVPRDPADDSE